MTKTIRTFIALALLTCGSLCAKAQDIPVYLNEKASVESRTEDLISRLTLDEKCSLLWGGSPAVKRLGIKSYTWWSECLHGIANLGTVYPTPLGMAASFDDELVYQVFCAISEEARARFNELEAVADPWERKGLNSGVNFFCPNINIIRDPRWGRGMESYGEDPYLVGRMGVAVVNGLQGIPGKDSLKVLACAKHYAVHSGPEAIRHRFDVDVSERDLRETYLPAFKELATKAKVGSVMFAYNSFRGKPCGASDYLIKDILQGEWGYRGIVLSDCAAIEDVWRNHKYVQTPQEACAAVIKAGSHLECGWTFETLADAVRQGLLEESEVDDCLRLVLAARFRLGVMDTEYKYAGLKPEVICSDEHKLLARRIAREGIVLLQNRDQLLPLAKDARVALVGPNGDDAEMLWGNYRGYPKDTVSFYDALKEIYPGIKYVRGCDLAVPIQQENAVPTATFAARYNVGDQKALEAGAQNADYNEVLSQLEDVDVVIFAGGLSSRLEGEEMNVSVQGFSGGDRTSIELPSSQRNLIAALSAAGKKVVFVIFSGSAIAIAPELGNCAAVLQAWYPGQDGAFAVTDVLTGAYNPSGKLPVTIYSSDSQLAGDFCDYSMQGRTYRFMKEKPLFPFGFGLSYTNFTYSKVRYHSFFGFKWISVKVRNTGNVDGEDVVQLYVSRNSDAQGPVKTLRGFKRISLKAGRRTKVRFRLDDSVFEWWNPETSRMEVMKGDYKFYVGSSSDDADLTAVTGSK